MPSGSVCLHLFKLNYNSADMNISLVVSSCVVEMNS